MRIAVFADIHSNYTAFKTCFEKALAEGATEFIFLGDYLGDMANPRETMEFIYQIKDKYPCTFIRGNKEDYWLNHRKNEATEVWELGTTSTGMLKYNYDNTTDEDLSFFESMPITKNLKYEGLPEITVCHGSPFKVNQSLREDYDYIDDVAAQFENDIVICGHFHIQSKYERAGKTIVNPGAVGIALHSEGKAQFMIISGEDQWHFDFYTVDYDVDEAIGAMDEAKLYEKAPGWYKITKHLLQTGEISHATVVGRVMQKYEEQTGIQTIFGIPEEFWNVAIDEVLNGAY